MNAPIKAVLFDLDDTLWPIAPVIAQAEIAMHTWLASHAPRVASRHSIEQLRARRMELLETEPRYRINLTELRRAVLHEAFAAVEEDIRSVQGALDAFLAARNKVTLYEDVLPVISKLRGRAVLGSISNGVADLRAIGLAHHFQFSIAAHQIGCVKPDAAIFRAACKALGVAPEQALYVGDDPELDIAGAQRAGLRAAWMNRFGRTLPSHIIPEAQCRNLHELHDWLATHIPASATVDELPLAADRPAG
ncbi:MAG: HAD family hydrolase [Burkholderiales bacterium]|nr:HAD family hydrolase [Burkholderiales bacterium]